LLQRVVVLLLPAHFSAVSTNGPKLLNVTKETFGYAPNSYGTDAIHITQT